MCDCVGTDQQLGCEKKGGITAEKIQKKQNSSRNQPLPGRMVHLRIATADQAALIPMQNREQAMAVCNPYRDPESVLLFFKGADCPSR